MTTNSLLRKKAVVKDLVSTFWTLSSLDERPNSWAQWKDLILLAELILKGQWYSAGGHGFDVGISQSR